jgi:hypothetical protein
MQRSFVSGIFSSEYVAQVAIVNHQFIVDPERIDPLKLVQVASSVLGITSCCMFDHDVDMISVFVGIAGLRIEQLDMNIVPRTRRRICL